MLLSPFSLGPCVRIASRHGYDDLPNRLPPAERIHRGNHVFEWVHMPHQRADAPRLIQSDELLVHLANRVWVQPMKESPVHAHEAVVLDKRVVHGRLWDPPARKPDDEQPPFERDAPARRVEHVSAHRIEDDVRAAARCERFHHLHKISAAVVDRLVRAKLAARLYLFRPARRRDDARARRFAELNRR